MPAQPAPDQPRTPSRERLHADILEAADALTDPRQHREPRWTWDDNRNRKPLPDHVTTIPGLIQQLRDMVEPGANNAGGEAKAASVPDSRPPLVLDAVSLLHAIEYGVAKRCLDLGLVRRDTAESNLRGIVGAAGRLPYDTQRVLASEVRSWRNQADVICRWRTGAMELVCPCPARDADGRVCGMRGTLLANPETHAAWCTACGAEWTPDDSPTLFRHYREYVDGSRLRAANVRAEVRARKAAASDAEAAVRQQRQELSAA